jgi:hypothetical protein
MNAGHRFHDGGRTYNTSAAIQMNFTPEAGYRPPVSVAKTISRVICGFTARRHL